MFSRTVPLCVVFLLFAAFTPAQDAKKELDALQGEWNADSVEKDGKKVPLGSGPKLTIKGDQWVVKVGNIEEKITFKIDPTKTPKTIDLTYPAGIAKGIYKLEDGVFTLCRAVGAARPTEFKSGGGDVVMVYKRAKK